MDDSTAGTVDHTIDDGLGNNVSSISLSHFALEGDTREGDIDNEDDSALDTLLHPMKTVDAYGNLLYVTRSDKTSLIARQNMT